MGRIDSDTLYGTLSLLILQTLAAGPLHGLEIQRRIHAMAGESLQVEEGALYPALHRLERDGLLTADWGISSKNRRAKFYTLSSEGSRHLGTAKAGWLAHVQAVLRLLDESLEGAEG
jgi:PadR family transcriptional regulator PadR